MLGRRNAPIVIGILAAFAIAGVAGVFSNRVASHNSATATAPTPPPASATTGSAAAPVQSR